VTTLRGQRARPAELHDVETLVELRAVMFAAMGVPGVEQVAWRQEAAEWFRSRLPSPAVHIEVVEVDGEVVAAAMGSHRDSAPSPTSPRGGDVLVSNVVVRPGHRRQGHARRAISGVLSWAEARGVARVELVATGEGRGLYEGLGFQEATYPLMRMQLVG